MGIDRNAPFLSTEASGGLAPLGLVIARRREQPTYEQPRLQLPLPVPPREPAPRVVPADDDETRERSPTRGVNVFDMV